MQVDVYDLNKPENTQWRERFERYRHEVILAGTDEKRENYTERRFAIDEQLGTFLMVDREADRIAALAAVFRPAHWPTEVARIGNRTWIDPDYRASSLSGRDKGGTSLRTGNRWGVTYAYQQQMACCLAHGVRVPVMSRENRPGKANTMRASWLGLIKVHPEWRYDDNVYFLTCANEDSYACWQKMVWKELVPDSERFIRMVKTISADEFNSRFARA